MTVAWTSYLAEVLPDVPGCAQVQAVNAIRNAAIDFCDKSRIWRYTFTNKVALVANQSSYDLSALADMPSGALIAAVLAVGFFSVGATASIPVPGPYSDLELDALRPGWGEEANTGTTNSPLFFTADGATVRLVPIPVANQSNALNARVALKPSRASTGGPDVLYNDYLEFIASGAKWKLMAQPKKDYSNPDLALYHEKEFRRGISIALAKTLKGNGQQSATAYPRQFGR